MNLIKLNPLKKLMLVVLSWFVHTVYHVEVHAWHIGKKTDDFNDINTFTYYKSPSSGDSYCPGGESDEYYIFPGALHLKGAFYVYYPAGNKYSQVPTSGVLCLTAQEFTDMQNFFQNFNRYGSITQNWGNCMAINCCDGKIVSCAVAATCGSVLSGQMFPVLLASDSSMTHGSGFSSAYGYAYAAAEVQIPNEGTKSTHGCVLEPGWYVASANASGGIDEAFKECPAGYFCPGGSSFPIGVGMASLNKNAGRVACSAGHYCPAGASSATKCKRGYFANKPLATSCTQCPPTSLYYMLGKTWYTENATTSDIGATSDTECYVDVKDPNPNISKYYLLKGENGVFAYTDACYYS